MRWLVWTGGLVAAGGLWWLFQGVDLAAGGSGRTALVGGTVLVLGGTVLVALGMRSGPRTR